MPTLKIYGSPGTGKTSRLVEEIQSRNLQPHQILAVSFSKKGAATLRERLGVYGADHWFRTQHSASLKLLGFSHDKLAVKYLGEFARKYNYPMRRYLSSQDTDDVILPTEAITDRVHIGDVFMNAYDRQRSLLATPQQCAPTGIGMLTAYLTFIKSYEDWKEEHGYLDFYDVIIQCIEQKLVPQGILLYVHDEFQDSTPLLARQAAQWREQIPDSIIAGDDDQSIFSYAGADPKLFNEIEGKDILLEVGHRCKSAIHDFATTLILRNKNRKTKPYTAEHEGGEVYRVRDVGRISSAIEHYKDRSIMVLSRNRIFLQKIKQDLITFGVPVAVDREKLQALDLFHNTPAIFDARHLALLSSPLFPSSRYFKRGAKKAMKEAVLVSHSLNTQLTYTLDDLSTEFMATPELAHDILAHDTTHLNMSRDEFKYHTQVYEKYKTHPPAIGLHTIHAAKGGEADVVFLLNDITAKVRDEERRGDIEAERRVWYVGITRAKDVLVICDNVLNENKHVTLNLI